MFNKEMDKILSGRTYSENFIKKNYIDFYNNIIEFNKKSKNISWLNKLYNYINNIHGKTCENCGNSLQFKNRINIGYGTYCSQKCTSQATRSIVKETNLKKYGVEYPLQNKEILEKVVNTNLKKYGVRSPLSNCNVREKIKKTNLRKYGVENISQSSEIREKVIKTNLRKYGVENISQLPEIREKIKQTNLKKYGVENVLILDENREKMIQKNLQIFDVEYPLQNKEIRDKAKTTNKIKYGAENISKSIYYKERINDGVIRKWSEILKINEKNINYKDGVFIIKNYCAIHSVFKIKYDDLYNRVYLGCENVCTKCNKINKQSRIKEFELNTFLNKITNELIKNNRKILNGKEIDFYLPHNNLGIEFDGLYWHSHLYVMNNYHLNKTELCEKQGIQLLHVFEDEWIFKKEIVKSIIKSKIGIIENKIFARKTEVKKINDNKLIRDFLNDNHIQGFVGSNIKIGLFYENELVALMTFGKKRVALGNKMNNDGEYEMLRFCNKLNIQVIGGASKLLKYFIRNYYPKSIISFADRRYSQGKLYEKLGFEFIENTKPSYWYFKKNEMIRYHRFNFRKDILVKEGYDKNKTEHEIMIEKKYYRIYDCGNMKFILNNFKK